MTLLRIHRYLFCTLRGRLIVGVAAVHAVMMAVFVTDLTLRQRAMLLERQTEQASALAQALATSASGWIASDDIAGLQELVDAQRCYPEVLFALLADARGRILAHSDASRLGLHLLDLPHAPHLTVFSRTPAMVDVAAPAVIGGRPVGWARVGIGQQTAGMKLARITRSGVLYALAAVLTGSVVAWRMGRRFTRRLYTVQETINRVRAGDRQARSNCPGIDEAAAMAREFNAMLDAVAARDAELRASEEKYRNLVQTIQAAVVVHGTDTRVLTSNPVAQQLLGLSEAEITGKLALDSSWHFFREDGTALPLEEYPVNRVLAASQPLRNAVLRVRRAAPGDDIWVLVNGDPVLDDQGKMIQIVVTFVDITQRLNLESQLRQAQKMESIGRLAGGVAHDFNNMLEVIIGHAEISLLRMSPTDPLYASLQEIKKAGERSASLTRQLLAFARKQAVTPKVLDLNATVEGMIKMLHHMIGEDIALSWIPGTNVWPVRADPSQIDQILANLCVNARDAIAGVGRIAIETRAVSLDKAGCAGRPEFVPGDYVVVSVRDDGCGMDRATLDRIFEPFFTTKGTDKGTGLGLATVYGIVKQNNGFIDVESEPGHGTTFKIYLPRYKAENGPLRSDASVAPNTRGNEVVLVVEDEPALLKVTRTMLERQGYQVLPTTSPDAAIRTAREHTGPIHLVLSDIVMPEMSGRDLVKHLLVSRPELKCLFMSGYAGEAVARNGASNGIDLLTKPFSLHDLATRVRRALDGKPAHSASSAPPRRETGV